MKVKLGDREIDLHPMMDVPKLQTAGILCLMAMGEAQTLTTVRGEKLTLRLHECEDLLRQVNSAG